MCLQSSHKLEAEDRCAVEFEAQADRLPLPTAQVLSAPRNVLNAAADQHLAVVDAEAVDFAPPFVEDSNTDVGFVELAPGEAADEWPR